MTMLRSVAEGFRSWIVNLTVTFAFATACLGATAPSIIPQPASMTAVPGVFTLCPSARSPNANARGTRTIYVDAASADNGKYMAMMLARSTGFEFPVVTTSGAGPIRGGLLLTTVNPPANQGPESYELTIGGEFVVVRGTDQAGVFYGIQSFLQSLPPQIMSRSPVSGVSWTAPCVHIVDKPRFHWRGAMLDVSRHFFDKQEVERILDAMALHKLNTFHWHLTDDHGWRIEIKSYPLLTSTGAWRKGIDYCQNPAASTAFNTAGQYGSYYTQDDIREVVAYAAQRQITIVPEIEMPAHMTAALLSYPSIACGQDPSHFNMDAIEYSNSLMSVASPDAGLFMTNVLTEIVGLFPSHYIHCGGDEVVVTGDTNWAIYPYDANELAALNISTTTPSTSTWKQPYQRHFTTNLVAFLTSMGRQVIGWTEFEAAGTIIGATLMDWKQASAIPSATMVNALTKKQNVVVARQEYGYFNYYETPQTAGAKSVEPYFNTGIPPTSLTLDKVYSLDPLSGVTIHPELVLGAECLLWSEYVPSGLNAEYKLFPRACAMAESTWTPLALKNYNDFLARLNTDVQRMDYMGINYNRHSAGQDPPKIGDLPTYATLSSQGPQLVSFSVPVTKPGEIDISFVPLSPNTNLVSNVSLLRDGQQIDLDSHVGTLQASPFPQNSPDKLPYYIFHLPVYVPGNYSVQATISVLNAPTSPVSGPVGEVHIVNWN